MTDRLEPGTKAWNDRMSRHKHNSFTGFAVMMRANCITIIYSETVTEDAKQTAREILNKTEKLEKELKTRVDP